MTSINENKMNIDRTSIAVFFVNYFSRSSRVKVYLAGLYIF